MASKNQPPSGLRQYTCSCTSTSPNNLTQCSCSTRFYARRGLDEDAVKCVDCAGGTHTWS